MRDFFRSVKFRIFVVAACVLIGLMLRTAATGGLSTFAQNALSTVLSPFQTASAYVSNAFSGFISNIVNMGTLKQENTALKKEVSDLETKIVDSNELKRKYENLKGLVSITEEKDDRQYTPAMVISRDPGQWFSSFTIDKGTLAGVAKNDPVITSDGLIGIVVTPGLNTSVVSTVLDPTVHVGCIVSQTGDTGITQGSRELSTQGEFRLNYLSKNSAASVGNILITTGTGGMFPKNLKVGTIQRLEQDESGNSLSAILKPMADPSSVKDVFVITDFSGKEASGASSSASGTKPKGGK